MVGGEIPLTIPTGPEDNHAAMWDLSSDCCIDSLRYLTASGEMFMEETESGVFAWSNLIPVIMFDLADGSRTYLFANVIISYLSASDTLGLSAIAVILASPPGYATVDLAALAFAGLDTPAVTAGPPIVPDHYQVQMWWDSVTPHDVQIVMRAGVGSASSAAVGFTFTGGEPFLLNGNPAPLSDALFGGFANGGFLDSMLIVNGSVRSWASGCAAEFPGTWTEVPFDGDSPPCVPENFQDGFEGAAGQVASPPYLNPSVVAM